MKKLSTVIITFNEEKKIGRCIKSVADISDEVVVLDSFSSDKTVSIAESLGAKIYQHEFLGFIKQRELSIEKASYDLVLALDADEFLDKELLEEVKKVKENQRYDCYKLNRISSLEGHWLKWGTWYPHRIIRLFDRKKVIASGNPPHDRVLPIKAATVTSLKGLLKHEAYDTIQDRLEGVQRHAFAAANHRHKMGQGSFKTKMYLKTVWKFVHEYFIRLGFLDGRYGYHAAKSNAIYIYIREKHLIEMK